MQGDSNRSSPKLKILQVLTLNGDSGIYGGPSQVAQNLCVALKKNGYHSTILSGCLKKESSIANDLSEFQSVQVKSILVSQPLTTLFSVTMLRTLIRRIRKSDIVHIHFARELIPISATVICILLKKKYFLQTHGMVKPDQRIFIRILDIFIIRKLLRKAFRILALTPIELERLRQYSQNNIEILPNGIDFEFYSDSNITKVNSVVFCSRINKRKRPELFVDAAIEIMDEYPDISFEIYGPNGGGLEQLEEHINQRGFKIHDFYFGPLSHAETRVKLAESLVSVLPSLEEPFPMVILESLAAGTPVVVMPSCHISETLRKINSSFVALDESASGVAGALRIQLSRLRNNPDWYETKKVSFPYFGQEAVTERLIEIYESQLDT